MTTAQEQVQFNPVFYQIDKNGPGGGNQPGGQQPSCEGSGLTQDTETENQNPSGAAPPGQN
jgi:hypothetical protein